MQQGPGAVRAGEYLLKGILQPAFLARMPFPWGVVHTWIQSVCPFLGTVCLGHLDTFF